MGLRDIKMKQWSDKYCKVCKKRMNKWDERCSKALRTQPTCESCLAEKFDKPIDEFVKWLYEVSDIRKCQF